MERLTRKPQLPLLAVALAATAALTLVLASKTTFYAEYGTKGEGASAKTRVPWAKSLTDEQAAALTPQAVLGGSDGWNPLASNPKTLSVR